MLILLYGYYGYNNLGDDLFEYIYKKYFESKNLNYIIMNPSNLNINYENVSKVNIIFLGGGEIINDYFIIPIFKYIKYHNLYFVSIYGASIGYNNNLSSEYIKFIDKCIFRNKLDIIDNNNYYYDNDIVFSLKNYINLDDYKTEIIKNTIGYYLIDKMSDDKYEILKKFTIYIIKNYKIRFIIFHEEYDLLIINKLIEDCNLKEDNYEIVIRKNNLDILKEIYKNSKHLCLRYHSHIICYLFKVQFISLPLSDKTLFFDKYYDIKYSFNLEEIIKLLYRQNIKFIELKFNMENIDNFFSIDNSKQNIKNKLLTIWGVYNEIYDNFIKILKNKNNIIDIDLYINYISNQIELNVLNNINTNYRYGIKIKLKDLINRYEKDNIILQSEFIKIMTNIYGK
jgi:hypothetical protein